MRSYAFDNGASSAKNTFKRQLQKGRDPYFWNAESTSTALMLDFSSQKPIAIYIYIFPSTGAARAKRKNVKNDGGWLCLARRPFERLIFEALRARVKFSFGDCRLKPKTTYLSRSWTLQIPEIGGGGAAGFSDRMVLPMQKNHKINNSYLFFPSRVAGWAEQPKQQGKKQKNHTKHKNQTKKEHEKKNRNGNGTTEICRKIE